MSDRQSQVENQDRTEAAEATWVAQVPSFVDFPPPHLEKPQTQRGKEYKFTAAYPHQKMLPNPKGELQERTLFIRARYDADDQDKTYRTWYATVEANGTDGWRTKNMVDVLLPALGGFWPLYNLHLLQNGNPQEHEIWVVGGEKTANHVNNVLCPDSVIAVSATVMGEIDSFNKRDSYDWSELARYSRVVVFADNDRKGRTAAQLVASLNPNWLVAQLPDPDRFPNGWDLADTNDPRDSELLRNAAVPLAELEENLLPNPLGEVLERHVRFVGDRFVCIDMPGAGYSYVSRNLLASEASGVPPLLDRKKLIEVNEPHSEVFIGQRGGAHWINPAMSYLRSDRIKRHDGLVYENLDYTGPGFNLFRGYNYEPEEGDTSWVEELVLDLICGGDIGLAKWVWHWWADMVQNPTAKPPGFGSALVMFGPQGTGKSTLADFMLHPFHRANRFSGGDSRIFQETFNGFLFGVTPVKMEEAGFGRDKRWYDRQKDLITNPEFAMRKMYRDPINLKLAARFVMPTNQEDPINLDNTDRRFTMIHVDGKNKGSRGEKYWRELRTKWGNGLAAATLHKLLSLQVDRVLANNGYETAEKAKQKLISDPLLGVLADMAYAGGAYDIKGGVARVSTTWLLEKVRAADKHTRETLHSLGARLRYMGFEHARDIAYPKRSQIGQSSVLKDPVVLTQVAYGRGFELGTLNELRQKLEGFGIPASDTPTDWEEIRPEEVRGGTTAGDEAGADKLTDSKRDG